MIKILNFKNQDTFDPKIYKDEKISQHLNEYNLLVKKNIDHIEKIINKNYFKVPYVIAEHSWGFEKVFLPFSNRLIKVLNTTKGNTSVQIHPLKSEKYISLNNATYIFNGKNEYHLKYNEFVDIKNNSVHSLKIGSKVLEEQDNIIFDDKETLRLYDYLGRDVASEKEYLKYLLPQFRGEYTIYSNPPEYDLNNKNKLVFIIDGTIIIEDNGTEVLLDECEELYYIKKDVIIKKITGLVRFMECTFYGVYDE